MATKEGRLARRRFTAIPPLPPRKSRAIRASYRGPLLGSFGWPMMAVSRPFSLTPSPGRRFRGNGEINRGFYAAISVRESGSSGAAATDRDSNRMIRKPRTRHRQFTGASFRTLIADEGIDLPLFKAPDRLACGFVEIAYEISP